MWTPPSDSESDDWSTQLQVLVDDEWKDFDYAKDKLAKGTECTFFAKFIKVSSKYRKRTWRLIIVDEAQFTESNTNTVDEPCNMQLVPSDDKSETDWFGRFTVSAAVAAVAGKQIRIGMVDQAARKKKEADPQHQKTPLGVCTPSACKLT